MVTVFTRREQKKVLNGGKGGLGKAGGVSKQIIEEGGGTLIVLLMHFGTILFQDLVLGRTFSSGGKVGWG